MKQVIQVFFFTLISHLGFAQEFTPSLTKKIKVVSEDTITHFEVKRVVSEQFKLESGKRYYWYLKNEIHSNIGGFYGNLLHGSFEILMKNELNCKGQFDEGLKTGKWKYWFSNGTYSAITEWKEGLKNGVQKLFYSSGIIKSSFNFKNNLENGSYQLYDDKGKLKEQGKYKEGLKSGKIITYNNGERQIEQYKNGEEIIPKPKKLKEKKEGRTEKFSFKEKLNGLFKNKEKTENKQTQEKKERFKAIKNLFKKNKEK